VVSDWDAIRELTVHGFTANDKDAVSEAVNAGIDMEMASIAQDYVDEQQIDNMVCHILKLKFQLGLFDNPYTDPGRFPRCVNEEHLQAARAAAMRSCVLLKNDQATLPLSKGQLDSVAVIGPLADDGYEQLGTWVFDGESHHSHTCLQAIHELVGEDLEVRWARGMETSRCRNHDGFHEAVQIAEESDVVLMFMGEESILSGEAHCRAEIDLPGNQEQLIDAIAATGTPVVLVIMAGRPLTLQNVADKVSALLYAWHPGTMGGPAIADLLFGIESPSGKLPVTFPRLVGQIPIYYSRKNTGRPASHDSITHIDDIDGKAAQTSLGMSAFHLDAGFTPLFPFGYGLSYARFEVQLYVRDLVGDVTRPVKELKGFRRIRLKPGESKRVSFNLHTDELAFYNRKMSLVTEPGLFHAWIGGSSETELGTEFEIVASPQVAD
jgi:beta-glucosidase